MSQARQRITHYLLLAATNTNELDELVNSAIDNVNMQPFGGPVVVRSTKTRDADTYTLFCQAVVEYQKEEEEE